MKKYDTYCDFCGKGLKSGEGKIKKFSVEDFYRCYCEACHMLDFPEWSEEHGYNYCKEANTDELLIPAYDKWGFKI